MAEGRRKVAVVTGASSGIGKVTAAALAARGWQVIGTGRDEGRSAAAEREIAAAVAQGGSIAMLRVDLSLIADVERLAGEIAARTDRIDVLVNNAGGMAREKVVTAEGLEANFAGNHVGPFHLTNLLVPLLKHAAAAAPAGGVRIINTASDASEMIPGLDLDNLQMLDRYNNGHAYCRSKLANVLHARGLAGRLAADGIVAHAVHPGAVDTNFINSADEQSRRTIAATDKVSPDDGADTLIWLATAEEPGRSSGGYFFRRAVRPPNPVVDDPAVVDGLWAGTEALVAQARR